MHFDQAVTQHLQALSPRRGESTALAGYTTGPSSSGTASAWFKSDKLLKLTELAAPEIAFLYSSFVLFFMLLPSLLKGNKRFYLVNNCLKKTSLAGEVNVSEDICEN